jgi:hypothetical protein
MEGSIGNRQKTRAITIIHSVIAKSLARLRELTPCIRYNCIRSSYAEPKRRTDRPIFFPARRAFAVPALTLSRSNSLSNSATAPKIRNVNRSVVSMLWRSETRSTSKDLHSSEMFSKCFSDLASRSKLHTRITSTFRLRRSLSSDFNAGRRRRGTSEPRNRMMFRQQGTLLSQPLHMLRQIDRPRNRRTQLLVWVHADEIQNRNR